MRKLPVTLALAGFCAVNKLVLGRAAEGGATVLDNETFATKRGAVGLAAASSAAALGVMSFTSLSSGNSSQVH